MLAQPATIYSVFGDDDYDVYFGGPCNIIWEADTALYYKVRFSYAGWSVYSSVQHPQFNGAATGSYTYKYTIPMNLLEKIPSATTAEMSVTLFTYTDSKCNNQLTPSSEVSCIVKLRDQDAFPTMEFVNVDTYNADSTIIMWDVPVAGFSKLRIHVGAKGIYGSSIASFSVSGDVSAYIPRSLISDNSASYISAIINTPGTKTITVSCTDTRGHTSTKSISKSIDFLNYSAPKITEIKASRNEYNQIIVNASWKYSSVDNLNSTFSYIYYKESTATDWTRYNRELANGETVTLSSVSTLNNVSYNIRVEVEDLTGNADRKESFVSTSAVILDFRADGYGFGVGKVCEEDGMEVSMETTFFGPINIGSKEQTLENYIRSVVEIPSARDIVDVVYPVGSIYITTVFPENYTPAAIFGGSWVQLKDRFLLGAGDTYSGMSVGGEASHVLLEREMPKHRHYGNTRSYYDNVGATGTHPPAQPHSSLSNSSLFSNYAGGLDDGRPGSCAAHNNMPPYIAVYIWQRIA